MSIPDLNTFTPATVNLNPTPEISLPVMAWMLDYTAPLIPADAAPWMMSQGWNIVSVSYDPGTVPPTPYYNFARTGMATPQVLQSLVNVYTNQYNEGRKLNSDRYDNIVTNWSSLIDATISDLDAAADASNTTLGLAISNLDSALSTVGSLLSTQVSQISTDATNLGSAMTTYLAKLATLETNYSGATTAIEAIVTAEGSLASTFATDSDSRLTDLEADLDTHAAAVEAALAEIAPEEADAESDLTTHAVSFLAAIDVFQENYDVLAGVINALATAADTAFSTHDDAVTDLLDSLATDYTTHNSQITTLRTSADALMVTHAAQYSAVLELLPEDWATHAATTAGLLDGLGDAELARINEQFAASLSEQTQMLVDNGLYSSQVLADIRERNSRDRNEAIAALYDKLNREKLENEHRQYEQLAAVRDKTLAGLRSTHGLKQALLQYHVELLTRTYGELQDVRNRTLAGTNAVYQLQQGVLAFRSELKLRLGAMEEATQARVVDGLQAIQGLRQAFRAWVVGDHLNVASGRAGLLGAVAGVRSQLAAGVERNHAAQQAVKQALYSHRDRLLAQMQDATGKVAEGQARGVQLQLQNAQYVTEARGRMAALQMESAMNAARALLEKNTQEMSLIKYQVDTQNNLIVGLFNFQEKRMDTYPSIDVLARLCSQLGDTAATSWISP